jgi:ABC-type glycerol-3-phosphate transport system substrate-binding protein
VNGGLDPVRWSTYDQPGYQKFVTPELASAARSAVESAAVSWPTIEKWPELQEVLHQNLVLSLKQTKTPAQALDDTQAAWLEILKK